MRGLEAAVERIICLRPLPLCGRLPLLGRGVP